MHRSPVALPLCLVLLSPTWFQARASPIPRNFHPLKDSPWGCLTVIFVLALALTILFIFKKIYVARRRKLDSVSISSDDFSPRTSNRKEGISMTKAIPKKSGFYVGLLGSPGWETERSVLVGAGPRQISLLPESRTPSRRRAPPGLTVATALRKVPARCVTSPRPAPSNVLWDKIHPLYAAVLPAELSRPPPATVTPNRFCPCLHTESPLCTRPLSSALITQDDQHGDFQSNKNITLDSGPRNLVLVSGLNSLQPRTDHFKLSSFAGFKDEQRFSGTYDTSAVDIAIPTQTFRTWTKHAQLPSDLVENSIQESIIKPLHFGSLPKKRGRSISENSQKLYSDSDNANDPNLETPTQDFSAASPPKASHKTPDSPNFCHQFVDLSSNAVRLKPHSSSPTRRTPIIGPSPLRTMSLPSDYDFEHTKKPNVSNCNTLSEIQSEAKFESSLESLPSSSHSSPISKRSKMVLQADDPDIILDLIRELAQETSAWDASLFVDENFKAMMDQSKTNPSSNLKIQIAQEKQSKFRQRRRTTSFVPLQDIPESDVAIVFSDDWHLGEAQSFWEDEIGSAYQRNAQPQPPSLNIGPFAY